MPIAIANFLAPLSIITDPELTSPGDTSHDEPGKGWFGFATVLLSEEDAQLPAYPDAVRDNYFHALVGYAD